MQQLAQNFLQLLAPYAQSLNFQVLDLSADYITVKVPENKAIVRDIGVICGQSIMSAADSLGPLCVICKMGEYRDMTTVNLYTQFLRPIPAGAFVAKLELVRLGRRLSVVDARFFPEGDNKLCATATITYSFLTSSDTSG